MLVEIVAFFSCDRCGESFSVPMDPAYSPGKRPVEVEPGKWRIKVRSLFECAEDAIRATIECSVDGDKHLCAKCTDESDKEVDSE